MDDATFVIANDDATHTTYVVPSLGITRFPAYLAHKFAKQLADTIVVKRGIRENYELDTKKLREEILPT